ncbi:MAG: repressor LexA [Clostridiales bacterium]|nr:repressor LexA [Clostridiales bacterium]
MKLNIEQRRIVELEPSGHMLVKGVAGSGKTTVSIRRVPFLLNHYCHEEDDKILLVTYNRTLLNYIKYQYNAVENEEEYQSEFWPVSSDNVNITTIESLMYRYFSAYQRNKNIRLNLVDNVVQRNKMIQAINIVSERYPTIKLLTPKNHIFLLDEIDWIKACNIADIDTYQGIDRIGRADGGSSTPQKLIKNSPTRAAIFELMIEYDRLLKKDNLIDFKTMNILALDQVYRNTKEKYTHIIIDESQDLTKVQLEFLKCVYQEKKHSSIMFVADNTQSIYSHSWLGKGRPYTSIGYDMSGRSRTLSKNYRTTTEISTAAYGLIEHDEQIKGNVDYVRPSLIDRQGHPPIYNFFKTGEDQLVFLANEVSLLRRDYKYSDISIVARTSRSIENVQTYLESKNIPCEILNRNNPDFGSDKIKLVTIHSIKGLEFKIIFLVDLNEGVIPNTTFADFDEEESYDSDERKLLYVGMTRANDLLYMSSVQKPSKFIKEIKNKHLRMKRDCSIRPFKSLGIYEYQLTDQIIDINAREEIIRQWMIKELNTSYGYPLELLELEYSVQQFSRRGYVDIAVNIYRNGEEIPYIFCEVKRFGIGIQDGIHQLRSYMEADNKVRYGVITDGLDILVINREGEEVIDIPKCNPHFLPERKDNKAYINFKNNKKYLYSYDIDNESHVEISDYDSKLHIQLGSIVDIPVIGEVAAGLPTVVNQEYDDYIKVPEDWMYSKDDTFALRVTGDSMNGIGIDRDDLVIVHRQNTAANGDIVIAVINQEATMKKFMPMGSSVLLISENPAYEPIQMNKEDIIINGRVIGVMKE